MHCMQPALLVRASRSPAAPDPASHAVDAPPRQLSCGALPRCELRSVRRRHPEEPLRVRWGMKMVGCSFEPKRSYLDAGIR